MIEKRTSITSKMQIGHILALAQKVHLRTEMEVFLAYLLSCDRLTLIANSNEEVSVEKLAALQKGWLEIQAGKPIAYLTHVKEFYGLPFYVDERVLIPRPETEILVDLVLKYAKNSVLEIGTGSGAIACSVKKLRPDLKVLATDISKEALEVANKNCVQHGVEVELIESDLLTKVPHERFDVLVANLPYIGTVLHAAIEENVGKFEPHLALFGGEDGLDLYRRLFEQILERDGQFKWIMGEIGFSQGEALIALTQAILPTYKCTISRDLQSLDRYFVLERP